MKKLITILTVACLVSAPAFAEHHEGGMLHNTKDAMKQDMNNLKNKAMDGVMEHKSVISQFDTDSDGNVSEDEYMDGQEEHFEKYDANDDEMLDMKEQAEMAKAWSMK